MRHKWEVNPPIYALSIVILTTRRYVVVYYFLCTNIPNKRRRYAFTAMVIDQVVYYQGILSDGSVDCFGYFAFTVSIRSAQTVAAHLLLVPPLMPDKSWQQIVALARDNQARA